MKWYGTDSTDEFETLVEVTLTDDGLPHIGSVVIVDWTDDEPNRSSP